MSKEEEKSKGGCFGKLVLLLVLLGLVGLGAALYYVPQAQDLSDISGYAPGDAVGASPPRDIEEVLRKSVEGGYAVTLSEGELNAWLLRELSLKQEGHLAEWVDLKRVWVRLREDVAEVIIEREIEGYPFTVSMFLQVEQTESSKGIATRVHLHGGGFHDVLPRPTKGGRIGKLMVPQGFLLLLMPSFQKLATVFETEIELGFEQMARIKIEDKRLVLDPTAPTRTVDRESRSF